MNDSTPPRPTTLEELLRLKRAERPDEAFWSQWEADLRQKQLSALLPRRRWWHGLQVPWRRLARYHVAVGASAAVVATIFVVRAHQSGAGLAASAGAGPAVAPVVAHDAGASEREWVAAHGAFAVENLVADAGETVPAAMTGSSERDRPAAADGRRSENEGEDVSPSEFVPWVAVAMASEPASHAPSSRIMEANLAEARSVVPEIVDALSQPGSLRVATTMQPVMAQASDLVSSDLNPRAARLLTYTSDDPQYQAEVARAPGSVLRQKAISRLEQDALYDSVRRLSAGGDRLSIAF